MTRTTDLVGEATARPLGSLSDDRASPLAYVLTVEEDGGKNEARSVAGIGVVSALAWGTC